MKTYGLIGEHLSHSFSKEIHESIADYRYDLIPLDKEAFCSFMEDRDFAAVNVTIPYKKAVIPYLDELDEAAQAIGAHEWKKGADHRQRRGFCSGAGGRPSRRRRTDGHRRYR